MQKIFLCICCYCISSSWAFASSTDFVTSPDGNVRFTVNIKEGKLTYAVDFKKSSVITPSAIGVIINGQPFVNITAISSVKAYIINETYKTLGVHNMAHNNANGKKFNIKSGGLSLVLDARVYNDGVAFRYIIGNQGNAIIEKETTEFNIPVGTTVWAQSNIKYYEGSYKKRNIQDFKAGELAGPPLTLELPGNAGYAAITEGGLVDFAGMSLMANGNNGFTANLTGTTQKTGVVQSPWRIIEVGKDLNTLVNCDIVTNVSPAADPKLFPQGSNTKWVKPGRSVWSWLAKSREIKLENMKHFSDLASQLGFEYNLVDEGWSDWKDGERDQWDMMKELVDYSATKGVKIWVWKAYPDRNGIPGINTVEKRKDFFKKCKELGIAGLKIDFFDSESQEIIDFYQDALRDAAAYQLMINFHGANKPTGENRTWPNELTREGIRGLENRSPWAPGNTTLPFTRYLAGPADFTPVHFGDRLGEVSWAHHVATMVTHTSPFLCIGADPQSVLDNPCKQMIQSIPPVWDETIVLPQSKIGELALFARRKGSTWYIAALNGSVDSKTINVNLSFLKKGLYNFSILKDDPAKQANVLPDSAKLSAKQSLKIVMNGSGGFIAKINN
ncbi:glycoside hydrolase family 97 catalytic domain-containing protein [Mucilaginibacter terrae]|uniref:glycoside hydrolase family 97 protein n=1 Tax=Mucilaginibacter terrae TaxID=1955052 RepID=UPI00363636FD